MNTTLGIYHRDAAKFIQQYDNALFAEVHMPLCEQLYRVKPGRALDIGAGSGRDARALSAMGYRVTAVEPVDAFRIHGAFHPDNNEIQWINDSLPSLRFIYGQFDVVLLSAVLMHLPAQAQCESLMRALSLTKEHGLCAFSLRQGDFTDGRESFATDEATLRDCVLPYAQIVHHEKGVRDALLRQDVAWDSWIVKRNGVAIAP